MNVSHGIGDNAKHVEKNRHLIARSIGGKKLIFAEQVHGHRILVLDGSPDGDANLHFQQPLIGDAMVTDVAEKFLVIQIADCQAVLMYEPTRHVVANVHCGWRGSTQNIIGRTVDVMKHYFRCRPESIRAGIGPSLGPCCAEFINYKTEFPAAFWSYKDSNDHFDFWAISCDQLTRAGVLEKHIECSKMCTRCRDDDFFSYRAERTTGRFAAVIGLKEACGDSIAVQS